MASLTFSMGRDWKKASHADLIGTAYAIAM
jgi:hypothetical protein